MNPIYIVAKFEDRYTFMPAAYNKEYEIGVFQMTVSISSSKTILSERFFAFIFIRDEKISK